MKRIILGATTLLLLSGCASINQGKVVQAGAAAAQALTISDNQVSQLCKEFMVKSDNENTILPASDAYSKRLNSIMSRFNNISSMNVNYKVYQSNTVNAFASGDGSIRVYSGLMDVMTDDEIFAVVGHELGHVKNKDVRDAYRQAYLMVAARYGISAVSNTNIAEGMLGDIAQQLASSAYSRKQEYEADEAAFQFCIANGVNAYAMYDALNVLIRLSGNSSTQGSVAKMFSTHPDSAKRAARIKDMANGAGYTYTKTASDPTTGGSSNSQTGTSTTIKPKTGTSTNSTVTPKTGTNTNGSNNTKPIKVKKG